MAFLDRFAAAADAGFTAVEYLFPYDHPPEEIARRLARHNLKQVLFNLAPGDFAGGDRGIATFPERRDEFRAAIATGLEYARATGTPRLHLMAGAASGPEALASYRDSIKFTCEAAAKDGIDILIEPINNHDIPGYLMNDFGLAERLITELKLPNFWLQFDIYHRQRHAWRSDQGAGSAAADHPPHADRLGAVPARAHHRRAGRPPHPAARRTPGLCRLHRLRIRSRRRHLGGPGLDENSLALRITCHGPRSAGHPDDAHA